MTNDVYKSKAQSVKDRQLCPSPPPTKNKIFSTMLKVQADAVVSCPLFKHKPMPWLPMFIHHCQRVGLKHPREAAPLWKYTQPSKA